MMKSLRKKLQSDGPDAPDQCSGCRKIVLLSVFPTICVWFQNGDPHRITGPSAYRRADLQRDHIRRDQTR